MTKELRATKIKLHPGFSSTPTLQLFCVNENITQSWRADIVRLWWSNLLPLMGLFKSWDSPPLHHHDLEFDFQTGAQANGPLLEEITNTFSHSAQDAVRLWVAQLWKRKHDKWMTHQRLVLLLMLPLFFERYQLVKVPCNCRDDCSPFKSTV